MRCEASVGRDGLQCVRSAVALVDLVARVARDEWANDSVPVCGQHLKLAIDGRFVGYSACAEYSLLAKAKAGANAPASARRGSGRVHTTPPSGDAE